MGFINHVEAQRVLRVRRGAIRRRRRLQHQLLKKPLANGGDWDPTLDGQNVQDVTPYSLSAFVLPFPRLGYHWQAALLDPIARDLTRDLTKIATRIDSFVVLVVVVCNTHQGRYHPRHHFSYYITHRDSSLRAFEVTIVALMHPVSAYCISIHI